MGLRVKRYGPLSTMVVVGRLVGTSEPALVIVTMAHATSASARTNTIAPSQLAGTSTGRNGKGTSQLSASPAMTASPHASGGRIMTRAVSAVSSMAGLGTQGPCLGHLADLRQYGGSIKVARGSAAARARTQESNERSR